MLVKFDCGCVGIINVQGHPEGWPLVLKPCDLGRGDWDDVQVYRRDLRDKGYEPLDEDQARELVTELGRLVADGYRLRQIQFLLR